MIRDPTDKRYRKPRQLRGTVYQKYVRRFAFGVTFLHGLMLYAFYKKHMPQLSYEEIKELQQEYGEFPRYDDEPILPLSEIYHKLKNIWKKENVSEDIGENKQE